MDYRGRLIRMIVQYQFDERFDYWRQIKLMAEHGMLSQAYCKALLYELEALVEHDRDYPCFLHRDPEADQLYAEGKPELRLGAVVDRPDLEIGLRLDGPVFVLVSGLTGFGKTTAIRVLLKAVHDYNQQHNDRRIVVIVFDRKGGDYADLPAVFGWKHFHGYETMRLAWENPPGVPPQVWINVVSSAFRARAGLEYAGITLASEMKTLLGLLNRTPSGRLNWPDPRLLLEVLQTLPPTCFSAKAEYTLSLIQALTAVVQSSYGTFEAFQGFRVDDLIAAGQSAVIAIPNMEPGWLQQFFVDLILLQALRGRIERSQRVDQTDVLFVIEEADADLHMHTEQLFSSRMSPISECFKRAREFGIGAIAAVSSLRSISPLVRENATAHIMFRAPDALARAEAAQTLSLPRGGELTLDHLPKGQCLVKQAGPWPHAMRVQVDRMLPCRTKATHYDRHPHVPSQPLAQMPELRQALCDMLDATTKRRVAGQSAQLGEEAATLLKLTIAHSFVPIARLFEKMGQLSFSRQKTIRKELEDRKLAHFEETRIGKINVLLMEATEAGYMALGLKLDHSENGGRGTLTHRSFAHWVKWHFERQGLTALIEGVVPGTRHAADVLVKTPQGKYLAVEICVTCTDNLLSHCFACFEESTQIEGMTVITSTKSEARELKLEVYSALALKAYTERIDFRTVENYIPRTIEL